MEEYKTTAERVAEEQAKNQDKKASDKARKQAEKAKRKEAKAEKDREEVERKKAEGNFVVAKPREQAVQEEQEAEKKAHDEKVAEGKPSNFGDVQQMRYETSMDINNNKDVIDIKEKYRKGEASKDELKEVYSKVDPINGPNEAAQYIATGSKADDFIEGVTDKEHLGEVLEDGKIKSEEAPKEEEVEEKVEAPKKEEKAEEKEVEEKEVEVPENVTPKEAEEQKVTLKDQISNHKKALEEKLSTATPEEKTQIESQLKDLDNASSFLESTVNFTAEDAENLYKDMEGLENDVYKKELPKGLFGSWKDDLKKAGKDKEARKDVNRGYGWFLMNALGTAISNAPIPGAYGKQAGNQKSAWQERQETNIQRETERWNEAKDKKFEDTRKVLEEKFGKESGIIDSYNKLLESGANQRMINRLSEEKIIQSAYVADELGKILPGLDAESVMRSVLFGANGNWAPLLNSMSVLGKDEAIQAANILEDKGGSWGSKAGSWIKGLFD